MDNISFTFMPEANNIIMEWIKIAPSIVALIVAFVAPYVTRKLEIEKANHQFIFREKYMAFSAHYKHLLNFNNSLKETVIAFKNYAENPKTQEIFKLKKLYFSLFDSYKILIEEEPCIWLFSNTIIEQNRKQLKKLMFDFKKVFITKQFDNNFHIKQDEAASLIQITSNIQALMDDYLDYYKKEIKNLI